jgi:peptidoglycan hydrolase CwlO-like protein
MEFWMMANTNTNVMKNLISTSENSGLIPNEASSEEIRYYFESIDKKLTDILAAKQESINSLEQEIIRLHRQLDEKNIRITTLEEKLAECSKTSEGNKQLINKLLNDIDRLNQDVEWYKRTYVKRGILGTIKQKIFHDL